MIKHRLFDNKKMTTGSYIWFKGRRFATWHNGTTSYISNKQLKQKIFIPGCKGRPNRYMRLN